MSSSRTYTILTGSYPLLLNYPILVCFAASVFFAETEKSVLATWHRR